MAAAGPGELMSSAPAHEGTEPAPLPRVNILGVAVSVITLRDAIGAIEGWVKTRSRCRYVCITGVHGVIESQSDPILRAIHNRADLVTPDGMPLVWMARRLGRSGIGRVYGPDLMRELTDLSAREGLRQFYYGGAPGLADRLKSKLEAAHPGLQVVGTYSPPFRPMTGEEDDEIVSMLNEARPDILWVGLSTPKQELWMADHVGRIDVPVMIGVGAAFDFLAGEKRQAPRWIGECGLEWLFRLLTEPKRLWRRYARIVPSFLVRAGVQLYRHARTRTVTPTA